MELTHLGQGAGRGLHSPGLPGGHLDQDMGADRPGLEVFSEPKSVALDHAPALKALQAPLHGGARPAHPPGEVRRALPRVLPQGGQQGAH